MPGAFSHRIEHGRTNAGGDCLRCRVVPGFVTESFSHKVRTRVAHADEDRECLLVHGTGGPVLAHRALNVAETGHRIGLAGLVAELGEQADRLLEAGNRPLVIAKLVDPRRLALLEDLRGRAVEERLRRVAAADDERHVPCVGHVEDDARDRILLGPHLNVAVLFGDGAAAVVLQATEREEGLLAEKLGCFGEAREILRVHGMGGRYANQGVLYGVTRWQFEGQEIFKRAVQGMGDACESALKKIRASADDVGLVVPHQANLRIIEAVAKRAHIPMERVFVNVHRYGNMSSATVPVALCEALEEGRVKPRSLLLMPGFGGGLTYAAHAVRWGERVTPLRESTAELPPNHRTALELLKDVQERKLRPVARTW